MKTGALTHAADISMTFRDSNSIFRYEKRKNLFADAVCVAFNSFLCCSFLANRLAVSLKVNPVMNCRPSVRPSVHRPSVTDVLWLNGAR